MIEFLGWLLVWVVLGVGVLFMAGFVQGLAGVIL